MGLRFRKSIKIAPGVKLNINKKSCSVTVGKRGAHYTINSKGKHTASVGIPGTGLSYTHTSNGSKKNLSNKKMKEEKFSVGNRVAEETEGSLVSLESE